MESFKQSRLPSKLESVDKYTAISPPNKTDHKTKYIEMSNSHLRGTPKWQPPSLGDSRNPNNQPKPPSHYYSWNRTGHAHYLNQLMQSFMRLDAWTTNHHFCSLSQSLGPKRTRARNKFLAYASKLTIYILLHTVDIMYAHIIYNNLTNSGVNIKQHNNLHVMCDFN